MKPTSFDYHKPESLDEALDLLSTHGGDGKILAGGQSLIPMMNFRLVQPAVLIDINKMKNMQGIRQSDTGGLIIDALTREVALEKSSLISQNYPLLAQVLPHIGHWAIRTRGTLGGSLVHADPTGELPLAMLMLDGIMKVRSKGEERIIPAEEFFITYMTVDIQPEELLVSVELPTPEPAAWAFDEFSQRRGDFALVSTAAGMHLDSQGKIDFIRFGTGGMGPTPVRLRNVEDALLGQTPSAKLFQEVLDDVSLDETDPDADLHASVEYRTHLMKTLGKRVLEKSLRTYMEG